MSDSKGLHGPGDDAGPSRPGDKVIPVDFGVDGRPNDRVNPLDVPLDVQDGVNILVDSTGPNLVGVIFFGSRLLGTSPTEDSAADLFVVVEDYEEFYRDIGARLPAKRRTSIMSMLNRWLPPNIIYLRDPGDMRAGSKCFIISRRDFARDISRSAKDHFVRGRMTQRVQIVHARSTEDREQLERKLEVATGQSWEWVPIYLPERFTLRGYCMRMFAVSFGGEIRPEARSRVRELFDAQEAYLRLVYGRILEERVATGELTQEGKEYRLTGRPSFWRRLRWRLFFRKSKVRATLRWLKYMLTFDDWLEYIARKAERRTGVHLELTTAERRFPIIFLWPKAIKVFRAIRESPAPNGEKKSTKPRRSGDSR